MAVTPNPSVQVIVTLGRMPSDDEPFDERVLEAWAQALEGLDGPLTDEDAVELLDCFPPDDSDVSELAWTLLHVVESAPYGSTLLGQLDDRSWWVTLLRRRAERAGLLPPGLE